MSKVIFYYQTFKTQNNELISLDSILYNDSPVTHIHVASIHFGLDDNNDFKFLFGFVFKLFNKLKEFFYG